MDWKTSPESVVYEDALAFMDARVTDIHAGAAGDMVWLLEHPPLYTAGTSAKAQDLLHADFPVYEAGRGGQYTYHGPGQRIAYVMMDLKKRQSKPDIKRYVCNLEQWIINTLAEFGVKGERITGRIGIWVDMAPYGGAATEYKKIAAIGVRVRHWITLHGISINVNPDLSHFGGIVPCGISDAGVTSLADLGINASMQDIDAALKENWNGVFTSTQSCQIR